MSISSGLSDTSEINESSKLNVSDELEGFDSDACSKYSSNYSSISTLEHSFGELNLSEDLDEDTWLTIFQYFNYKTLMRYSLLSKKWHKMINPLIRKSIRLTRHKYIYKHYQDDKLSKNEKFEAEVKDCIEANKKYSEVIKAFKWYANMQINLAIEFFSIFNQLSTLTISQVSLGEDQILFSIRHLTQLKELKLDRMNILPSDITESEFIRVQFPQTLTILNINDVDLDNECKAFLSIFKAHQNFNTIVHDQYFKKPFLTPFTKTYPKLKSFSIFDYTPEMPTTLGKIFKNNHHLNELKYCSTKFKTIIVDSINLHLTHLTRLALTDTGAYVNQDETYPKMYLPNLKFLVIRLVTFNIDFLRALLTSAKMLESLDIGVNEDWRRWTKLIGQKCDNLKHLTFYNSPIFCLKGERYLSITKSFRCWLGTSFKCDDTLQTLGLINYSPYMAQQSQLYHFKNLRLIHFKDTVNYYAPSRIRRMNDHIKSFDQFPIIKFRKTNEGIEGYLKKNSNWTPISWGWKYSNPILENKSNN